MIFSGDVALGSKGMKLTIPESLAKVRWLVNLEGSLVKGGERHIPINGVFNDFEAVQELKEQINCYGVSLANNHILDAEAIEFSLRNAKELELDVIGAGRNIDKAGHCVEIDGFCIISFGWECIECPPASATKGGVNPYRKNHVVRSVKKLLASGKKVVCFFHWNYEFELYPQPMDRELAHQLIDLGVYAVIGAHAHRVQHYEIYKGHPIVYGLGNFMFSRKTFFSHRLDFGERSREEIVFELKDDDTFAVHNFEYSHEKNEVAYKHTVELTQSSRGNAPYENMSPEEYIKFFKQHRIQKKLLPIFYYDDSSLVYFIKCKFVSFRGSLINALVKIGAKGQRR